LELEGQPRLAEFDERLSQLERSIATVLSLLREILSLSSVKRLRKETGR
jgi:hypothetical protein